MSSSSNRRRRSPARNCTGWAQRNRRATSNREGRRMCLFHAQGRGQKAVHGGVRAPYVAPERAAIRAFPTHVARATARRRAEAAALGGVATTLQRARRHGAIEPLPTTMATATARLTIARAVAAAIVQAELRRVAKRRRRAAAARRVHRAVVARGAGDAAPPREAGAEPGGLALAVEAARVCALGLRAVEVAPTLQALAHTRRGAIAAAGARRGADGLCTCSTRPAGRARALAGGHARACSTTVGPGHTRTHTHTHTHTHTQRQR